MVSHLDNIPPLLEEVISPHTTLVDVTSDDEVDDKIVVNFPQDLDVENSYCDTSIDSCVVDDVVCENNMSGDQVALSTSCCDDFDLHEPSPCSCDDDTMCMDCIDFKYDRFVAWHAKNFGDVHTPSISTNDALNLDVKNVENCEQLPSFSSFDKHDDLSLFESIEHDEEFISPSFPHSSLTNTCDCDESCAICMEIDR